MSRFVPKDHPRMPEFRFGIKRVDEYLKIHAKRTPDKTCLNFYGKEITWAEMDLYVDQVATYLSKIGVHKGDAVCLFMQSCPQFVISFYAVQRIGAIVAPCSPMFKEWELEYEVNEVSAKVIISNTYLYPIIKNILGSSTLETVILSSLDDFLQDEPEIPFNFEAAEPETTEDAILFKDVFSETVPNVKPVDIDIEDIGLYIFTSGSTGLPKGAMLPYMSGLYKAVVIATCYHITEYTNYLNSQPIYHIAGMAFMNMHIYLGSTMYLITKIDAETILKTIDRFKCDFWYGSAVMNKKILEHPDLKKYDLNSLRQTVTTSFGIQLTEELAQQWYKATNGGTLVELSYGLSESHTIDSATPYGYPKYGTCGAAVFDDMEIKIVDENGNELPTGQQGEIIIRNPAVFKGYLNNPEATAKTLKDGWLYTGDTGILDEDGYLIFLGRMKEMIKTSGFSVFPEEIEMYICRNEMVAQTVVIGKPDDRKGEIIKAFIKLKDEYVGKVTEEEIKEWCKDKMATYKRPSEVEFVSEIPATGTGKVLRRVLRDREFKKAN